MKVLDQVLHRSARSALLIYAVEDSLKNGIETQTWPPLTLFRGQLLAEFAFILNRNSCVIDTVMYWSDLIQIGENKFLPDNISFERLLEPIHYLNEPVSERGFESVNEVCTAAPR